MTCANHLGSNGRRPEVCSIIQAMAVDGNCCRPAYFRQVSTLVSSLGMWNTLPNRMLAREISNSRLDVVPQSLER